jgi:predicted Zn-dependent protease
MTDTRATLTYEEKNALDVLRKAMKRKPQIAAALMEGMAKEVAHTVLKQVARELSDLTTVARTFSEAAATLAKIDKDKEKTE